MNLTRSLLTLVLVCTSITLAQAHAFLDHAEPRVGSTLATPPPQVKIWFTEELEGAFSKIQVFDRKGTQVDGRNSKVDPGNQTVMAVSLPRLPAGSYKVKWSAVAVDTHHTAGTFEFTVKGS